nr:hypothetical protein Iba_chr02cCG10680 [Ipomoea batatas]
MGARNRIRIRHQKTAQRRSHKTGVPPARIPSIGTCISSHCRQKVKHAGRYVNRLFGLRGPQVRENSLRSECENLLVHPKRNPILGLQRMVLRGLNLNGDVIDLNLTGFFLCKQVNAIAPGLLHLNDP